MNNKKFHIMIITFIIMISLLIGNVLNLSILLESNSSNTLFNIITINSILVGFLFSALGIFSSLNKTKTYEILSHTPYVRKTEDYMLLGILCGLVSISFSIFYLVIDFRKLLDFLFSKDTIIMFIPKINLLVSFFIIYTLVLSLIYFSFSLKNIYLIISQERKQTKDPSQQEKDRRDEMINRIKNKL